MLTQGSIVMSIRSKKYFDCQCYGVVVSARCDIANRKVEKIYYLEALSLESWIFSSAGFTVLVSNKINTINENLDKLCRSNGLDWNTLKSFSCAEFTKVINSEMSENDANKVINYFDEYKKYTEKNLSIDEKKALLKPNEKAISSTISDIANGKFTHYAYIPSSGFNDEIQNGIVVDLQELDYFDFETTTDLENFVIDNKNLLLDDEKQMQYNRKFRLDEEPGYAIALCNITSPWIEYLMQRFSNVFIRIGVDSPSKNDFKNLIDEIIK